MPAPETLTLWRNYVKAYPVQPDRLTPTQIKALSTKARDEHKIARQNWINADVALTTSDLRTISERVRILTIQNRVPSATARRGLAISGAATLGKSTIALNVARNHERRERKRLGDNSLDIAPALYVVVPPATTAKALMQRFATALGQTYPSRATTLEVRDLVVETLTTLRTSLVVVDEVHEVRTNRAHGAEAASTMKLFAEQIDATFLYVGIDLPSSDLFYGAYGKAIEGRMNLFQMRRFLPHRPDDVTEWCDFIRASEQHYGLHKHPEGTLEPIAVDLMNALGGSIGMLRGTLNTAATAAVEDGSERITRQLLIEHGVKLGKRAATPTALPPVSATAGS